MTRARWRAGYEVKSAAFQPSFYPTLAEAKEQRNRLEAAYPEMLVSIGNAVEKTSAEAYVSHEQRVREIAQEEIAATLREITRQVKPIFPGAP